MRLVLALAALTFVAMPAAAALKQGATAPQVVADGAFAGKPYKLDLKRRLKKGPVVLYFFPQAGTRGCDLEAHAFSEAITQFRKAGAQVVGMSADSKDILTAYSVKTCSSAFPVATATPDILKAYDVASTDHPGLATRTSYVIARNGTIVMVHDDRDWSQHVAKTLAAVKAIKR